ncbi:uncharacterized protein ACN63O_003495 [Diretmus argenteus]
MHSKHRPSAGPQTLKEFWFGICAFYSTLCLVVLPSEAARLRCGSDLLTDLIFVCGDRGIYLGKGNWSGYGMRPRGKGIVDHCCRPAGCDLQHLEMYCAKSNSHGQRRTTAKQFQDVFQRRLLEHMGAPNSPKREAYRKKTHHSHRRKNKASSSRKRPATSRPTPTSGYPKNNKTTTNFDLNMNLTEQG